LNREISETTENSSKTVLPEKNMKVRYGAVQTKIIVGVEFTSKVLYKIIRPRQAFLTKHFVAHFLTI